MATRYVPKAYGIVFATGMLQAEQRALDRAQFTADITNLAMSAGVSHFETRMEQSYCCGMRRTLKLL